MKVILLTDVRKLGRAHEVKEVSEGFAANFLFPQKLAEPATKAKLAALAEEAGARQKEQEARDAALAGHIHEVRGKTITLQARATEKGGLFKQVTAGDISRALAAQLQIGIPEEAIEIPEHLKTVGEHAVVARAKDTHATFTVTIQAA